MSDIYISPLEPLTFTMRDASLHKMGEGRPAGRHLSEIIKEMKKAAGGKVTGIEGEDENVRPQEGFWWEMAMQLAFEHFMEAEDPIITWQIRALYDNIHATPDGWDRRDGSLVSVKHTAMTMKRWHEDTEAVNAGGVPESFSWWFAHDMGCMKMINETMAIGRPPLGPIYKVRYFIHWSHGDYRRGPSGRPQPTTCTVTFSPEKIEENWKLILRYRDWLDQKEKQDVENPEAGAGAR